MSTVTGGAAALGGQVQHPMYANQDVEFEDGFMSDADLLFMDDPYQDDGVDDNNPIEFRLYHIEAHKEATKHLQIIYPATKERGAFKNQKLRRLLNFQRIIPAHEFDTEKFTQIFYEAAEIMGVPGPKAKRLEDLDKRFSDDILKIELSGPEHKHLSVVDVPGLFHSKQIEIMRYRLGGDEY